MSSMNRSPSFKKRVRNLLSGSPSPPSSTLSPPYTPPPGGSYLQRRKSDASSPFKTLRAMAVTANPTRARRHVRAQSDASSNRPHLARTGSETYDLEADDEGTARPRGPRNRGHSFRHEEYPRSPESLNRDEHTTAIGDDDVQGADPEEDLKIPALLQQGTPMLKVSAKKTKTVIFRLDADLGQILWESKKSGIITIENIKEIRSGEEETRYYREQLNIAALFGARWMTIIYIIEGKYKTLHLVTFTDDVFRLWNVTLRRLHDLRQDLMSGLGNLERRQMVWEKHYWKGADASGDQKLSFEEVEAMCARLNIKSSREDLLNRFMEADSRTRGYLDFNDFKRFVKLLKARPEISQLYNQCRGNREFTYSVFEQFMRTCQKSNDSAHELQRIFTKFATRGSRTDSTPLIEPDPPGPVPGPSNSNEAASTPDPTLTPEPQPPVSSNDTPTNDNSQRQAAAHPAEEPSVSSPSPIHLPSASPNPTLPTEPPGSLPLSRSPPPISPLSTTFTPSTVVTPPTPVTPQNVSPPGLTWSLDTFTSFLMSADNSPFTEHTNKIWHDMSRPLSEYFISSSHNTYLVGHQLVGDSTIEGYIRALLHGCRSVELDIWDGDNEPAIYHGRTLTSKVSLTDVAQAIHKYAFVASPYPVIISAEIHCNLEQQEMVAKILKDVFGSTLITETLDGENQIKVLPSPERLKHRILLKAKNLYVTTSGEIQPYTPPVDTESSSTETSSSDAEPIKDIKEEFQKARGFVNRVRGKQPPPPPPSRQNSSSVKMSMALAALLVYTVGVKCRGFNKKEKYAVEHVFSLSERTANKILKQSMVDLVKHNRTHVSRVYPNGTRVSSTNYEPHRYWAAGAQLVAINWQTFDLGYMMNYAMFQRNGRCGYVLKPTALRIKEFRSPLHKRTKHFLDITIISAQQLPRPKDDAGREISSKHTIDPFVEVSLHIPDWSQSPFLPDGSFGGPTYSPPNNSTSPTGSASSARTVMRGTAVVKNNGFNPVWMETMSLPFDCVGGMTDLIFVKVAVKDANDEDYNLAGYCTPLGCLQMGYRHLPLHDVQLSQYLFSTLFVKTVIRNA